MTQYISRIRRDFCIFKQNLYFWYLAWRSFVIRLYLFQTIALAEHQSHEWGKSQQLIQLMFLFKSTVKYIVSKRGTSNKIPFFVWLEIWLLAMLLAATSVVSHVHRDAVTPVERREAEHEERHTNPSWATINWNKEFYLYLREVLPTRVSDLLTLTKKLELLNSGEVAQNIFVKLPHSIHLLLLVHLNETSIEQR